MSPIRAESDREGFNGFSFLYMIFLFSELKLSKDPRRRSAAPHRPRTDSEAVNPFVLCIR